MLIRAEGKRKDVDKGGGGEKGKRGQGGDGIKKIGI